MRFRVTSTPPPDDKVLSPLTDPRLTSLELRARDDKNNEVTLGRARYDGSHTLGTAEPLNLGSLPVGGKRDMRLVALGAAGQQVLGLALTRDIEIAFGVSKEYFFELRRPLILAGSGRKLVPGIPLIEMDRPFSPGRRILDGYRDETLLRVFDPNSGRPLLSTYSPMLEPGQQATASAPTADGLSVLVTTSGGNLYNIETLRMKAASSARLPATSLAQAIAVSPKDDSAVILHYDIPVPMTGRAAQLTFVRDLSGLRGRISKDGAAITKDIEAMPGVTMGPLSAAYAPDGLVDIVFGRPPLSGGDIDCMALSGPGKSVLRRYDARSGDMKSQVSLEYTTGVAYNPAGERILVQPCVKVGNRFGSVLIQRSQGDVMTTRAKLAAPGATSVVVAGGGAIISVGRDDSLEAMDDTTVAGGTVRILEPDLNDWSQLSFPLSEWLLPWVLTGTAGGKLLPSSVEVVLAPRELLVYQVAATPDRSRAMVLTRTTHKVSNLALEVYSEAGRTYSCRLTWLGYTYHMLLLNFQTGAREQDFLTGVQNQTCESMLVDNLGNTYGACFPCDFRLTNPDRTIRLRTYQEGFIPSGTSALFAGQ